jgi:hypothetical protein
MYIKWGRERTVRPLRGEGTASSQTSALRYPPCRDNFPSSNLCTDSEWYPIHWKSNSEQVYFISCLRRVQKLPETIPIHEPYWIPVLLWTVNGTTFDLINRGAQRSFLKGDKVLCLLRLGVLPHTLGGGGVRRFSFGNFSLYAPDSPSRHPCTHQSQVWFRMAFDPTPGKTQRTCQMPIPPVSQQLEDGQSTPSGMVGLSSKSLRVFLTRTTLRNFNPNAQRQCRYRTVTPRGEIKILGRRVYVDQHLAGARVMVKLSDGVATIYHGERVIQKQI